MGCPARCPPAPSAPEPHAPTIDLTCFHLSSVEHRIRISDVQGQLQLETLSLILSDTSVQKTSVVTVEAVAGSRDKDLEKEFMQWIPPL